MGADMKNILGDSVHKKSVVFIVLGLVVGLVLILYPTKGDNKTEKSEVDDYYKVSFYTQNLEERIKNLCLSVNGINNVSVLLTLESGSEYVYANNEEENTNGDSSHSYASDYLIVESGEGSEPVLVTEIYPKIRGVAVVCSGGDSADVKEKVTSLLSAALGISTNRIKVSS